MSNDYLEKFIKQRIDYLIKNNDNIVFTSKDLTIYQSVKIEAYNPCCHRFFFDKTNPISMVVGLCDIFEFYFDDTKSIINIFCDKLKKCKKCLNIEDICRLVAATIFEYVGVHVLDSAPQDRFKHVKSADDLADGEKNYISSFKGTGHAWCVERATIAHQIFQFLCVETELVTSRITVDGQPEFHAYNLIKNGDDVILFDSSLLDFSNGKLNESCIAERNLPNEIFDDPIQLPPRQITTKIGQTQIINYGVFDRNKLLSTVICGTQFDFKPGKENIL